MDTEVILTTAINNIKSRPNTSAFIKVNLLHHLSQKHAVVRDRQLCRSIWEEIKILINHGNHAGNINLLENIVTQTDTSSEFVDQVQVNYQRRKDELETQLRKSKGSGIGAGNAEVELALCQELSKGIKCN